MYSHLPLLLHSDTCSGKTVYANPRAIMALSRQCNTVNITRRSPSFEHRLYKYSKRGFEVRLPALRRESIRESVSAPIFYYVFSRWMSFKLYHPDVPSRMPKGLARLLILEHLSHGGYYYNFQSPRVRRLEGNDRTPHPRPQLGLDSVEATSWYDSGMIRIPYGGRWNASKIGKLLDSMVWKLMISWVMFVFLLSM